MHHKNSRRGSSLIEFTMVGIPLMFTLIGIFELSRAMWVYTTVAHAVREGNRFAIVHGKDCAAHPQCARSISQVATVIRDNGVGLMPNELLNVTFISSTRQVNCG